MNDGNAKTVLAILPQQFANSSASATGSVDCLGYDYCNLYYLYGAQVGAGVPQLMKVEEATSAATNNNSAITGLVSGTDYTPVSVAQAGQTNAALQQHIALAGKQRYLIVSVKPTTQVGTGYAAVLATLHRGEEAPVSTTARGTLCNVSL